MMVLRMKNVSHPFCAVLLFSLYLRSSFGLFRGSSNVPLTAPHTPLTFVSSSSSSSPSEHKPRLERGKELKHPLNEEDLYQAYKEIQADYAQKAFRKENNWKIHHDRDGIEVALLEHPADPTCPYVRMKAVFPTSVERVWDFLSLHNWDRTMPKMDPFYEGVTIFGEFLYNKVHMILCRKRTKRILAFSKRDMVFLSVTDEPLPDGTWVSGTVAVRTPQIPREPGYTRAFQDSVAFYKPIEGNTKTALTIVCRIDLNDSGHDGSGGFIPMWLYVKTVGRTGALSVQNMKNALEEELAHERRRTIATLGE